MPSTSSEASVSRNYIDILLKLPWSKNVKIKKDLSQAEIILNQDHYGLDKVKDRIIEYLAVQQRMQKNKSPILCLVGPPGVGKTSLGKSIARATGRKYVRMALGGIKDEAEIRGHRRTYIGALPGQIIQKLIKIKINNPLFLLDEIDKMSSDFRGDPSSAMLEVLDPEQNNLFNDHYLDIDYDLSNIMFVATANNLNFSDALKDRMEIIYISGYTENEKANISKEYLLPKAIKENGINFAEIFVSNEVILEVIRHYTRESGVRKLQQEFSKFCRKVVKKILLEKKLKKVNVTIKSLIKFLGVRKYDFTSVQNTNKVGQVTGLAWTEVGGDLLTIETVVMQGKGKVKITGQLGEVMEESIYAAMTVIRKMSIFYNVEYSKYELMDFHIHVPEGAIPKDGPSAGIAMCTAMMSSVTKIPVYKDLAMTGEITLRGDVLPIGGLKEKLLAALRGGVKVVLIPKMNQKDLYEIPSNVKDNLSIITVSSIEEVLNLALVKKLLF
jgi:ATP-dependent Lon protease